MRKAIYILVAILTFTCPCKADDGSADFMSLIKLTPATATPDKITSILGHPAKVEENNKRTWWHYTSGNTNLVLCWNKKSDQLEKFSFDNVACEKCVFDGRVCKKLKSGTTNLTQCISLLGMPKDMTIKSVTQEMHYAYQKSVLRLFFRDRVLVDFTLLSQK